MSFGFMDSVLDTVEIGELFEVNAIITSKLTYLSHTEYGVYIAEDISVKYGGEFKMVGVFPIPLEEGRTYNIVGRVEIDKRKNGGGRQLHVMRYMIVKPETKEGLIEFLKTIKGISKVKATQIFKAFGHDSIEVLMNDPKRVMDEVPKTGEKTALKWQNEVRASINTNSILVKLMDFGISMKEAQKLHSIFGDDVVEFVTENPYMLMENVKGYGFEKCDKIAVKVGVNPRSSFRIQEGIIHTLKLETMKGHCYLPLSDLLKKSKLILDMKLSFQEMQKYKLEFSEKSKVIHKIGEEEFELDYNKLCDLCESYIKEPYQSRKINHRYPLIEFKESIIEKELRDMLDNQTRLIEEGNNIYLGDLYRAELEVAEKILSLCDTQGKKFSKKCVEKCLKEIIEEEGFELEEMQEKACIDFNLKKGGLFILNGSAGTGKTFTLNVLLEVARRVRAENSMPKPTILAFAPTGKASKVAAKAINMDCRTIHKGLGRDYETGGFEFNSKNPFKADIIVCDETSMLDIRIAKHFLSAIKDGTKVIFMGDTKQLASVGPGNVLKDIIESDTVPVITLNVIKRQGEQSGIVRNANRIIEKEIIQNPQDNEPKDSFFLEKYTDSGCRGTIIESIYRVMNNIKIEFNEIQVLSPQRTGALGVWALNYLLQQEFNPENKEKHKVTIPINKIKFKIDGKNEQEVVLSFRAGDKIINTKNDYDLKHYTKDFNGDLIEDKETKSGKNLGITNGECGVIESIEHINSLSDDEEKVTTRMVVRYDDFYAIYENDFSDLEHAYCITIHKSQGSAWKAVIMPVSNSHINMLDNNLIYTGWTRAREFAVVVGSKDAFAKGVRRSNALKRNTSLAMRLAQGRTL